MTDTRPNILWIFLEDQGPDFGCYGHPLVDTPNVDALAGEGVVFERAYSPAPVCSPSRSGVITGAYPIRNGTHIQRSSRFPGEEIHLPEGQKTLPELFREAGYFTFNRGKDDYNFDYDRSQLYTVGNDAIDPGSNKGVKAGAGHWRECPEGVPFFAQIQTNGSKNGYSLKQAESVMRKLGVEDPECIDPADVTVPPQYPDTLEMRKLIAAHLSTMLITDIEVGQMLRELKEDGHWGNTVIFLISDHGTYFPRAKQMCYVEGLHVPLIVAAPGMTSMQDKIPQGTRRKEQTALLDVAATTLGLADIPIPDWMDSADLFQSGYTRDHVFAARDRCEWVVDRTRTVIGERYRYLRNYMTDRPLAQYNYRSGWPSFVEIETMYQEGRLTPAQALPYGPRPAEELYDLQEDPNELVNLAGDESHAAILSEMRALLDDWVTETDDKGAHPENPVALKYVKMMFPEQCTDPLFDTVDTS